MHHPDPLDRFALLAPGHSEQPWSEAQALGSAVWLWMNSPMHRGLSLAMLNALLLPALKHRQFLIASEDDRPVFYLSWAFLDARAEACYVERSALHLSPQDWRSGDRLWAFDWIAPFGHTREMAQLLSRRLFARHWGRMLDHRGAERGLRVRTFQGIAVRAEEARRWFEAHPIETPTTPRRPT